MKDNYKTLWYNAQTLCIICIHKKEGGGREIITSIKNLKMQVGKSC